jgi:hypothetical protein
MRNNDFESKEFINAKKMYLTAIPCRYTSLN